MRFHSLHHASFEGLGVIQNWIEDQDYSLVSTYLNKGESLPNRDSFDHLIVMGGPMSINDEDDYPWLIQEKKFIRSCIEEGKKVLGICLGAQLISASLGSKVYKNEFKEIGWHAIFHSSASCDSIIQKVIPKELMSLHWHGDTFEVPQGAQLFLESRACPRQGYQYNDNVLALQCHLEWTKESVKQIMTHCPEDLESGPYVNSRDELFKNEDWFIKANTVMLDICRTFFGDETRDTRKN